MGAVEMSCGRRKQDADDLVLHEAEPLGAAAAVAIPQQHLLRSIARVDQFGLQELRHGRAEGVLAARVLFSQRVDRRRNPGGVENRVGFVLWLRDDTVHGLIGIGRGSCCHPAL